MHKLIIIAFTFVSTIALSQQDSMTFYWQLKLSLPIQEDAEWCVDALENIYMADKSVITKQDSTGVLKFSQSIKSLGRMKQMVPVNTMRLIHFSEEQQTLCYFDNTLTELDDCIDLSKEGIVIASLVSASNQPNKVWVLDQLNSNLVLLSLKDLSQQQNLQNISGILNLNEITQIIEKGNRLFLLDKTKGVYVFDYYGTLLEYIEVKNAMHIDAYEQSLFILCNDGKLMIRSLRNGSTLKIDLPLTGIIDFNYRNRLFYFRTRNTVYKFALQFSE